MTSLAAIRRPRRRIRSTARSPRWGSLSLRGPVELSIYSVDSRRARNLSNGVDEPGVYEFVWDGRDEGENAMRAGV